MSARFAPGQVVTVFRSRLREDAAPGYHETADEMLAIAQQIPGFVDYKFFVAEDGERVSIATFADHDAQRQWREQVEHRAAQQRGRREWYEWYSIQVADGISAREFTAT